jgi:hypothetical protein
MLELKDENILNELCDKYGSDKGSVKDDSLFYSHTAHNYTKIYASLFAKIKNNKLTIFECGLGTNNPEIPSSMGIYGKPGASLRVWKDYFSNSKIYGADIDKEILFTEDRIVTSFMDQTDSDSVAEFWNLHNIFPNIIIDDGLHEFYAGVSLFENSFDRLAKDGIYIIEDIDKNDVEKYKEYFNNNPNVLFISLGRSNAAWNDNTLIVIFK